MRGLVTGAAGFIGSHLVSALVRAGWQVRGVDCFTDAYDPTVKRANLDEQLQEQPFEFVEADLRTTDLSRLVADVDVVFHLAAIPGVRASWARFQDYLDHNVLVTQRILDRLAGRGTGRLVFASSSSVYGNALRYPSQEEDDKRPHSPYGVSKLSAEHLCETYADVYGVDVVRLRYFSVYGPRQRPDMGVHRLCEAALGSEVFRMLGDGSQIRDMTYVSDVVTATVAAAGAELPSCAVINVAGGSETTLRDLVDLVERAAGAPVPVITDPEAPGDVTRTGGDTRRARELLGWEPTVDLARGIAAQMSWHLERRQELA